MLMGSGVDDAVAAKSQEVGEAMDLGVHLVTTASALAFLAMDLVAELAATLQERMRARLGFRSRRFPKTHRTVDCMLACREWCPWRPDG